MRLLTVTHFFESHGGGIERVAGHLCRNLATLGHDCEWTASAADPAPADAAITATPLPCLNPTERLTGLPMPIPGPAGIRALARAIDRADVVIIHDALYCTSLAAMMLAKAKRKPVILFQHIAEIAFVSAAMRTVMACANWIVTRPMLGAADQVIFISATVAGSLSRYGTKHPARVLYNGIDGRNFHPGPADRRSFDLPETGGIVAFVGRFVDKKGIAVVRAVAACRPNITFAMVGSGPLRPSRWHLCNVRLLGTMTPQEVGKLFRVADMLLLPSVGEGYPLVIQEAMACGLSVICGAESARADPAAARWLQGVEVDPGDPEATAQRILPLLDRARATPDEQRDMADYAASAYSWSGMASAVGQIAIEIASRHRGIA